MDTIIVKFTKIFVILASNLLTQIAIYFLLWRPWSIYKLPLLLTGFFWFIIPIFGILLLTIIFIIFGSGIIAQMWIKDSTGGKKGYMILVLLAGVVLWLSTFRIFSILDQWTHYQYPTIGNL